MAAAVVTGLEIRQALVENGDWVFHGAATGTGGASASVIEDTEFLKGANIPSTLFANAIVRITSGTRAGEQVGVDYIDNSLGYLYVTPAMTGALTAADTYEVWLRGLDPDIIDRLRDDCLQKGNSQWRVQALSIIPDGDMDSSGVTNWTVAAGATRTKGFSSFPYAHSRRELSVVHTTAATDYVESDPVDCQPGERIFLQVPVRAYVTATPATPATASIDARDLTNVASITLGGWKSSHIGRGPGFIAILFTIPSGCYRFSIRLKSATAASTTVWGGINCHKLQKTQLSFPDRITAKKRIGRLYTKAVANPAVTQQSEQGWKLADFTNIERVQVGSQVELYVQPGFIEVPYFFYERGYFARLSTTYLTVAGRVVGDAASTDCQKEYIVAKLSARVAKWMLDKYGGDWQDDWVRLSAEDNYWEQEMGAEPVLVREAEVPAYVPQFKV